MPQNITAYSASGLTPSTQYHFRVRAFNAAGDSGYTNTASATTLTSSPAAPPAPSGLTVVAASASRINLLWTDNAGNEDGFKVERCSGQTCTNFVQIATVGSDVNSFANTGLTKNTMYRYRVRAYNTGGNSGYSNIASVKTLKK